MLKTALFDCTINEKCCSVHGGIQGKKMANARGSDRRTDAFTVKLIHNNKYCFFITIFRLAIPAFFRFTDVTSKQAVSITLFGPRSNNNSKLFWSSGWILSSSFFFFFSLRLFFIMDGVFKRTWVNVQPSWSPTWSILHIYWVVWIIFISYQRKLFCTRRAIWRARLVFKNNLT